MAKLQWNKMKAESRETLGNFAVAVWELADKKALYARTYKARKTCYETDLADLAKLEKGEKGVLRSKAEIEKSMADMKSIMDKAYNAEQTLETEIKERMKKAYALITDALHNAYENRAEKPDEYDKAIGDFLKSLGVEPTQAGIRALGAVVGDTETNGKKVVNDAENMGLANTKKEKYSRMFLKGVAREMVKSGCLRTDMYKFEFVDEKKSK